MKANPWSDTLDKYSNQLTDQQNQFSKACKQLESRLNFLEEKVLEIASNRKLTSKERTGLMFPLMEEQDLIRELIDDIKKLLEE